MQRMTYFSPSVQVFNEAVLSTKERTFQKFHWPLLQKKQHMHYQ